MDLRYLGEKGMRQCLTNIVQYVILREKPQVLFFPQQS